MLQATLASTRFLILMIERRGWCLEACGIVDNYGFCDSIPSGTFGTNIGSGKTVDIMFCDQA